MRAGALGEFHEAGQAASRPAWLRAEDGTFVVAREEAGPDAAPLVQAPAKAVTISARLQGVPRDVTFPDGSLFVTRDESALDTVFAEAGRVGWGHRRSRLEALGARWPIFLAAGLIFVMTGLYLSLPWIAHGVAGMVPLSLERAMGKGSLKSLDESVFEPSSLSEEEQEAVRRQLYEPLLAASGLPLDTPLVFRGGGPVGANAFALPGGPVVITDELIVLAPDDDALAAVLGHELAHVEHRHGLRRVIAGMVTVAVISLVVGDASELITEAAALPAMMLDNAYSRDFEREADSEAVRLLRDTGHDPEGFARMMAAFRDHCGGCGSGGWLSSHPSWEERISGAH